ncbi:hypothetical protein BST81_20695 [Leptolyngbya sp. 'hensonii']|uniref:hypothetical protein n=1 Tax=Leptolyngbya sp. 'hensonii' TaxID=1922337 RepID=UPI00094FAF0C|nr:hypothetical protein [Leptolyngbya sp. 'hensonii']OLP16617.1 hypothetical protein BST81_20695 [Leptolyngbya sp. 'hensonii']
MKYEPLIYARKFSEKLRCFWDSTSTRPKVLLICCLTILVFFLRRSDQFLDPQVWVEDGIYYLPSFLEDSFRSLLEPVPPVGGYLTVIPKLISGISLWLVGLHYYPIVSTVFSTLFSGLVMSLIALSPISLKGQVLLVIFALFIPTDVECFVLPSYTFWFAGLALFLLPFWNPDDSKSQKILRTITLWFCGLSSPAIVPVSTVLLVKSLISKRLFEALFTLQALLIAGIQIYIYSRNLQSSDQSASLMNLNKISIDHLDKIISKLFGYYSFYSFGNDEANLYFGFVIVTIIASAILLIAKKKEIAFENPLISLSFLLFLNIGLVAFRVSVSSIHPYLAGPRYFFYPFILLSWILVQISHQKSNVLRIPAIICLALAVLNALPKFQRHHESLKWNQAVNRLVQKGEATLPIHFDGVAARKWTVTLRACGDSFCLVRTSVWVP